MELSIASTVAKMILVSDHHKGGGCVLFFQDAALLGWRYIPDACLMFAFHFLDIDYDPEGCPN
jgi:hypothetical protein